MIPPISQPGRAGAPCVAIAIPARNEAALLPHCLQALAAQRAAPEFVAVLFANNCVDATAALARGMAGSLPFRLVVEEGDLPPEHQHAGHARGRAMEHAAALGPRALLATDADARPMTDWVARSFAHIRAGADAVAGRVIIEADAAAKLPMPVRLRSRKEAHLARLLDRIASLLDPLPWDPWPRHAGHWGANFAVTLEAFRRSGGIPPVPVAEDRAFFRALERVNAHIRHAEDSRVLVSARLEGRAAGGMADVLRRRSHAHDPFCDAALEPLSRALRRFRLRHVLRANPLALRGAALQRRLGLDRAALDALPPSRDFGATWDRLLELSPALRECRLPADQLDLQLAAALRLLRRLDPMGEPVAEALEESLV